MKFRMLVAISAVMVTVLGLFGSMVQQNELRDLGAVERMTGSYAPISRNDHHLY